MRGLQLRDQAQPYLDQLTRDTGETAHICVFEDGINFPFLFPGTKEFENKVPTIRITELSTIDGGPYRVLVACACILTNCGRLIFRLLAR